VHTLALTSLVVAGAADASATENLLEALLWSQPVTRARWWQSPALLRLLTDCWTRMGPGDRVQFTTVSGGFVQAVDTVVGVEAGPAPSLRPGPAPDSGRENPRSRREARGG